MNNKIITIIIFSIISLSFGCVGMQIVQPPPHRIEEEKSKEKKEHSHINRQMNKIIKSEINAANYV